MCVWREVVKRGIGQRVLTFVIFMSFMCICPVSLFVCMCVFARVCPWLCISVQRSQSPAELYSKASAPFIPSSRISVFGTFDARLVLWSDRPWPAQTKLPATWSSRKTLLLDLTCWHPENRSREMKQIFLLLLAGLVGWFGWFSLLLFVSHFLKV